MATVIRMQLANPVLRLFVSPVHLRFSADGRSFRGLIGRLLPVTVEHGRPRAVDGALVLDAQ